MDNTTSEMRIAGWKTIVENCQARPDGLTVKQWLAEQGIPEKRYYYWQRKVRKETFQLMTQGMTSVSSPARLSFAEIPMGCKAAASSEPSMSDAVIQKGSLRIELKNSVSDHILSRILEILSHA